MLKNILRCFNLFLLDDKAEYYGKKGQVCRAVRDSNLPRELLFISKYHLDT